MATVISKYVKVFLAKKKLAALKSKSEIKDLKVKHDKACELVSRHLRGYWHRQMIMWLRSQIKSIITIQTHWRMHKCKK